MRIAAERLQNRVGLRFPGVSGDGRDHLVHRGLVPRFVRAVKEHWLLHGLQEGGTVADRALPVELAGFEQIGEGEAGALQLNDRHGESFNSHSIMSRSASSAMTLNVLVGGAMMSAARLSDCGATESLPSGWVMSDSIFCIAGGDALPARGMRAKATVEMMATWVAFMPTNHKPIVKGTDHAIWRRLMLVPFTRNFDHDATIEKDSARAERLKAEAPGILAWLVRRALAYRRLGLQPPGIVAQARESYKAETDLLAEWIDECCEVDRRAVCASGELWQSWRSYAEQHGELRLVPNARLLGRQLVARGFESVRKTRGLQGRGFKGICVRASTDLDTRSLR
ncbi:putative primase/helicase protein [Burkholderia sp. YI23]|nr:putative primase/helicase protein [Burkholderia sp. YI23]